jgi:hypothetical protein
MRKLSLLLICLLSTLTCFGQKEDKKEELKIKGEFRIKMFVPIHFGNNFLAKSYDSNVGFGCNVDLMHYNNFILGGGFDYTSYATTDITRAGNIRNARLSSFYGNLSYKFVVNNKLNLVPHIAIGSSKIDFKSGDRNFGHQNGNDIRFGIYTDYKLNQSVGLFIELQYITSRFTINTSPEFVSFYDNAKIIQLGFGLKF